MLQPVTAVAATESNTSSPQYRCGEVAHASRPFRRSGRDEPVGVLSPSSRMGALPVADSSGTVGGSHVPDKRLRAELSKKFRRSRSKARRRNPVLVRKRSWTLSSQAATACSATRRLRSVPSAVKRPHRLCLVVPHMTAEHVVVVTSDGRRGADTTAPAGGHPPPVGRGRAGASLSTRASGSSAGLWRSAPGTRFMPSIARVVRSLYAFRHAVYRLGPTGSRSLLWERSHRQLSLICPTLPASGGTP